MGRIFGILLIVLGVWVGAELYSHGVDGAFGGVFARGADPAETLEPVTRRAGESVERAYDASEERIDRALDNAAR